MLTPADQTGNQQEGSKNEKTDGDDALDVIPMRMADQDVAAHAFSAGRHQILT